MKSYKENKKLEFVQKQSFAKEAPKYFLLVAMILMFAGFGLMKSSFYTITNMMNILRTASVLSLLSIGAMMVLQTGEINFSLGAQLTLAAAIFGRLMAMSIFKNNWLLGMLITIIPLVVVGTVTAYLIVKVHLPGFICTLALSTILYGIVKALTYNGTYYSGEWTNSFTFLGQGSIAKLIPIPLVILGIIVVITYIFTMRTKLGRHIFSTGANITASRQVGINVDKNKFIAYIFGAVLAGIAGILQASIGKGVDPMLGIEFQMPAIASAMLGATFLTIGRYNVLGSVIGSIIITTIQNGVISAGGSFYIKDISQGALLIISIAIIALVREEGLPKVKFTS